jgi:hypothetical protein
VTASVLLSPVSLASSAASRSASGFLIFKAICHTRTAIHHINITIYTVASSHLGQRHLTRGIQPDEARRAIGLCIVEIYNRQRLHSALGYPARAVFEAAVAA